VGYKPNYINNVDIFRVDTSVNYVAKVINTEVIQGKVRIFFNITDNNGKTYVYANKPKFDKIWCSFSEKLDNKDLPVKNHQIFHSTEKDTVANAFAFVLDHSGSMGDMRVLTVQNALSNFLTNGIKPEDAFAAIKYDNHVVVEVPLTKDENKLMSDFKVNGISEYGGTSAINDAMDKAIDLLDAAGNFANKAVVMFTDGVDNASKISQAEVISKAKSKGIKVFAIDFGAAANADHMSTIAAKTGGCYYHIYSSNEFNMIFTDIYKRMKNVYILEYTPSSFGQSMFRMVLCNNGKKIEMQSPVNYEPSKGYSILVNIKFDNNKSIIKSTYKSEIERLADLMNKFPDLKFEIQGHTENVGSAKNNMSLSQKRADAVKNELIKKGVDKLRLSAKGYGGTVPIADNKTKEGRLLNRRTELVVVE